MIVWINGAFGAGKTQTAHELCRRLARGWVCDPELLGFAIQRMQPPSRRADFQDEPLWRTGVRDLIGRLDDAPELSPVIVPMTMVEQRYFDEIIGGLRSDGHDLRHFALQTSPAVLLKRLRSRGLMFGLGRDLWAVQQIARCTNALARPEFGVGVPTDQITIGDVVETIAGQIGLPLVRPRESAPRRLVRNLGVQIRHIR